MAAEQLTSVCYTLCSMRGGEGARLTVTTSGEKAGCLYLLDCHNFMPTGNIAIINACLPSCFIKRNSYYRSFQLLCEWIHFRLTTGTLYSDFSTNGRLRKLPATEDYPISRWDAVRQSSSSNYVWITSYRVCVAVPTCCLCSERLAVLQGLLLVCTCTCVTCVALHVFCLCVWVRPMCSSRVHTYMCVYMSTCISLCVCVCVCGIVARPNYGLVWCTMLRHTQMHTHNYICTYVHHSTFWGSFLWLTYDDLRKGTQ